MDSDAWKQFTGIRTRYRREIAKLTDLLPELRNLQQQLVDSRGTKESHPAYLVETPVVYNSALDDIHADSDIRLILVADNPGRREQAAENRRYLVGPSGKIAEKFFRDNPILNIDFRKNVIILNKTPIHTPRTVELKELCKLGGNTLVAALNRSQRFMARLLLEFHQVFSDRSGTVIPVWITGYSEMKKNGVFETYTHELQSVYGSSTYKKSVFLYRHFSMNQFTIDLRQQAAPGEKLSQTLIRIGQAYRKKYLW